MHSFKDGVLQEPGEVLKDDGKPYGVFTAYARKWRLRSLDRVLPAAKLPRGKARLPRSLPLPSLESLGFELAIKLPAAGESAAGAQLNRFVRGPLLRYGDLRDLPAQAGTSQLSPHLRMGAISPRTVVAAAGAGGPRASGGAPSR